LGVALVVTKEAQVTPRKSGNRATWRVCKKRPKFSSTHFCEKIDKNVCNKKLTKQANFTIVKQ
jgi:hypothetical protein